MKKKTSVILLAGGTGTRMQTDKPKQFLQLGDKTVVQYSFDLFMGMPEIDEIIVVCEPIYQNYFAISSSAKPVRFVGPGHRRQDSVYNGLKACEASHDLICVHDGARPFIDRELVLRVLEGGALYGAATVGMPVNFTIKESDQEHLVKSTPNRTHLWESQTHQVVATQVLHDGFLYANTHQITVTDDVSLAELINKPVKLIEGSHRNLKITVPADLSIANYLLASKP